MSAIKNGMTVEVRDDIDVPDKLQRFYARGGTVKLELSGAMSSRVLPDGDVMIKGLGIFDADIFEEYVEPAKPETYELIIHTQNVFEQGGQHQKYSSVYEHHEEEHGVRVYTEMGEWFHPWSYDGSIRAVFVPK
jgi:hypothetical protein